VSLGQTVPRTAMRVRRGDVRREQIAPSARMETGPRRGLGESVPRALLMRVAVSAGTMTMVSAHIAKPVGLFVPAPTPRERSC
jgi:hypothetical protein